MEGAGFRVSSVQHFGRLTKLGGENGLRNWIEMFGGSLFKGVSDELKNSIITGVEESLRPVLYLDGAWYADYK
ncbi:hypothetical protein [Neobacillus sp. Marseille-QA0830]